MHERLPKNPATRTCTSSAEAKTYPIGNPNALYQPPQRLSRVMKGRRLNGIDRACSCNPIYGTDHSLFTTCLNAAPKVKVIAALHRRR